MRNKILFAFTLLTFVACAPMSKSSYMDQYSEFVKVVSQNASNYTEKDWVKQDEMYQKFSDKWYKKFQAEFTTSDKIMLAGYEVKYSYYRGLNKFGGWAIDAINSIDLESSAAAVRSLGNGLVDVVNQIGSDISVLDGEVNDLLEKLDAALNQSTSIVESGDKSINGSEQRDTEPAESDSSLNVLLEKMDSILNQLAGNE